MYKLGFMILMLIAVPLWAQVNEEQLAKCREYSNPQVRGKCMQLYKRTETRVASSKCKRDLECWSERYRDQAESHCGRAFTMRANHSALWSKYWQGQDFDKVRWIDRKVGTMLYYEKVSGAVLHCIFDPRIPSKVRVKIASPS